MLVPEPEAFRIVVPDGATRTVCVPGVMVVPPVWKIKVFDYLSYYFIQL